MMRPWLWMPAAWAHSLSPWALRLYGRFNSYQTLTWSPFSWRGIEFNNRLGIAGGVDKDATQVQGWWSLGVGFVEVGTVTPLPQPGNAGHRVDRDTSQFAVWNRLGFPSRGMEFAAQQLKALYQPHFTPIFANVGKNATTPLEKASGDYNAVMRKLRGLVDAFVINISSPNTAGLRQLLEPQNLRGFLEPILQENRQYENHPTPVLLKLSPDMSEEELASAVDTSYDLGVDGWILTNTSTRIREGLKFPNEGGVSGRPIASTSKRFLAQTLAHLGERRKDKLLVSVGGVLSPDDVFERLSMGADLVQVYSGLVFQGPTFFRQVAEQAALRVNS